MLSYWTPFNIKGKKNEKIKNKMVIIITLWSCVNIVNQSKGLHESSETSFKDRAVL